MKSRILILLCSLLPSLGWCQFSEQISQKVTLKVNTNIETYFIAEKLAVDHIGNYVFSNKESTFEHQPLVYFAYQHFKIWKNRPIILRVSEILKQLRDVQHDNAQQLEYLLYVNEFPKTGFRLPPPKDLAIYDNQRYPGTEALVTELTDSLASFYKQAQVGDFLKANRRFYRGALKEAKRHINTKAIPYMEKWYGQKFAGYEFYLMPGMPITKGADNYRAFGPMLSSPGGKVSAMVFSSSIELPLKKKLKDYRHFGFDNAQVIRFLTVHEVGHSFVNPLLSQMKSSIQRNNVLFTPSFKKSLEASYIENWEVCITEHLVRLGEIRIAKAMGDKKEELRLRKMHTHEFGFVLLPMLETLIVLYENNRNQYNNFNSFLPIIFQKLNELGPEDVDKLVKASQIQSKTI